MSKTSATLELTEPVIFLRSGSDSPSRRRRRGRAEYPPALLRGLLTLKVAKPLRVTSIDVVLEGTSRTDWPDIGGGIAARHTEVNEENVFLSSKVVLFQPDQQKRSRTIGPGLYLDDRAPQLLRSTTEESVDEEGSGRGRRPRRESADLFMFRRPLSTLNGRPAETQRSSGEEISTQQALNSGSNVTSSDSALDLPGPSVQSPAGNPPMYSALSQTKRSATTGHSTERKASNRRSARLSLSGMLHDMREIVQGHPNRRDMENQTALPPTFEDAIDDAIENRGRTRGRRDKSAMARLGEVLGIDMGDDNKDGEDEGSNWRELKPGIYHYPISFTLPTDLPPSISASNGSVEYKLKATVHRPGAFTPKITATTSVELISAPGEDDAEEGDPVVIERQWDLELRYLISVSGRNFPQGSEIPWHIQLMPLSKMKLHRITFMLEEKLTYQVDRHHLTRIEPTSRFQLLCVRHPQSLSTLKHFAHSAPPLLPIMSRDDSHSSEAVLLPFADPPPTLLSQQNEQEERTERLAHLMSPDGPWHLAGTLKVPQNYLHTSHQHPKSFVTIKHALKVYLRVEKGNDETDPKTGRKKQFDIIIETPVNILSKYCRHDWASLPPYESLDPVPTTGDEHAGEGEENGVRIGPTLQSRESSRSDLFMNPRSPIVSPAHISRPPSPLLGPTRVPSNPPSQPQTPSQAHPLRTDSPRRTRSSGPSTPIEGMTPVYSDRERERDGERGRGRDRESESRAQTSQRYASLMAGFEDEVGELPPTYQSVTGTPGAVQQCSPLGFPARSSPSRSASMGRSISVAVRQRGRYGTGASTRVSRENTPTGSGSRSRNPSRTRTAGDADANAGITAMNNASWVSAVDSTGTSYLELRSGSRTPDRHDPFVFFLPV